MGVMKELFQKLGKVPVLKEVLNSSHKGLLNVKIHPFSRYGGTPSGPLVNLGLEDSIAAKTD